MLAQLVRMSGQPRSCEILEMALVAALVSRRSRLWNWTGVPVVEWISVAVLWPRSCFWSRRALTMAPALERALDMFPPRPRASL